MVAVLPAVSVPTIQATDHCTGCGRYIFALQGRYEIDFGFFPRRRVRKRHKVKHHKARYCRHCYERREPLMYFIDGKPHFADRCPSEAPDPNTMACPLCGKRLYDILVGGGLYALAAIGVFLGELPVHGLPIATFCGECALEHDINFAVTTTQLTERN